VAFGFSAVLVFHESFLQEEEGKKKITKKENFTCKLQILD
jgi:hypothetical protein